MGQRAEPGEWLEEVNPYGGVSRYRMIGKVKEYEMMVQIDGIEVPESQVEEFNRRRKEQQAARIEAERRQTTEAQKLRNCPFASGLNPTCTGEKCALYLNGCAFRALTDSPGLQTQAKQCPFNSKRPCSDSCALYKNGCVITAIAKERMKENEQV